MEPLLLPAPSAPPAASDLSPASASKRPHRRRRRTGKIARLPKEVRDQVNLWLDDGLPYARIISQLGDHGKGLTRSHLTSWKKGGYQDHLREQERLRQCRARYALTRGLHTDQQGLEAYQVTPKVAVALLCETFLDLGPESLRRALAENPVSCFRLLTAMARLISGGLKCERHLATEAVRKSQTSGSEPSPDAKGISPEIVHELTDALNLM